MSVKEYLYVLFNVVPMSRHREMLVKFGELENRHLKFGEKLEMLKESIEKYSNPRGYYVGYKWNGDESPHFYADSVHIDDNGMYVFQVNIDLSDSMFGARKTIGYLHPNEYRTLVFVEEGEPNDD